MIESVLDISQEIMAHPKHVFLCEEQIEELALVFAQKEKDVLTDWSFSNWEFDGKKIQAKYIILCEIIASSINYCYWYGSSKVRPLGSSSTKMYDLLRAAVLQSVYDIRIY